MTSWYHRNQWNYWDFVLWRHFGHSLDIKLDSQFFLSSFKLNCVYVVAWCTAYFNILFVYIVCYVIINYVAFHWDTLLTFIFNFILFYLLQVRQQTMSCRPRQDRCWLRKSRQFHSLLSISFHFICM